jgi:DNA mismatch endonuclease (patch repair protein)
MLFVVADWMTHEQRTRNMTAIRSQGSAIERRLEGELRAAFPRRRLMTGFTKLPGRPDFYLPGLKLAAFADGCFWHGCPSHGRIPADNSAYWGAKLARNHQRDLEVNRALRAEGIIIARFWEHELRGNTSISAFRKLRRLRERFECR